MGRTARVAPQTGDPFVYKTMTVDGTDRTYALYVPPDYTPHEKWPLVVFLHGATRRGSDGVIQTDQGLGPAIIANPERFPCIVVMPQCPKGKYWPDVSDHIDTALAQTLRDYRIDGTRIYLTGLSLGGFGTFYYGADRSDTFAAMIPIAGGGMDRCVEGLKDTPMWVFHNKGDRTVSVSRSRSMVGSLKAAGSEVMYTEFPDKGHDAWTKAYNDPKVIDWLFSQHKDPVVTAGAQ
jgi:predicted peptidase